MLFYINLNRQNKIIIKLIRIFKYKISNNKKNQVYLSQNKNRMSFHHLFLWKSDKIIYKNNRISQ